MDQCDHTARFSISGELHEKAKGSTCLIRSAKTARIYGGSSAHAPAERAAKFKKKSGPNLADLRKPTCATWSLSLRPTRNGNQPKRMATTNSGFGPVRSSCSSTTSRRKMLLARIANSLQSKKLAKFRWTYQDTREQPGKCVTIMKQ